jgi:hypothetical protein
MTRLMSKTLVGYFRNEMYGNISSEKHIVHDIEWVKEC